MLDKIQPRVDRIREYRSEKSYIESSQVCRVDKALYSQRLNGRFVNSVYRTLRTKRISVIRKINPDSLD